MKFMRKEEQKGLRPLTNELKLEKGQKRGGKNDFNEEKGFGSREKRELLKCLSENKSGLTLEYIYIESGILTDRASIEKVSRIKAQRINRCRGGVDG